MFTGFKQMVEEINSSVDIIDTNKERNLLSSDPIFVSKFRKEWEEVTNKLRKCCVKAKQLKREEKHESIRYSSSAIEFR